MNIPMFFINSYIHILIHIFFVNSFIVYIFVKDLFRLAIKNAHEFTSYEDIL